MFVRSRGEDISVSTSRTTVVGSAFLNRNVPRALMERDGVIEPPGLLLRPVRDLPAFDRTALVVVDWGTIDIKRESRGAARDPNTVQGRMLEELSRDDSWQVIVDDDGSGEVADLVALSTHRNDIRIHLVHCKYLLEREPGARVEDLYEVCGQAQKSVLYRRNIDRMLQALIRRERLRRQRGATSGIERGDVSDLYRMFENTHLLRPSLTISIAQPGLSRDRASVQQLELLGCVEVYLRETADARFVAYCSC